MTLLELIQNAKEVGNMFNTWDIPLKYNNEDMEIMFDPAGSNDEGWIINMEIKKQ